MAQAITFDAYRRAKLVESQVHDLIMRCYRGGVINIQRIDDVLEAYETPPHDWGAPTVWRLFNATTFALSGRVAENPAATREPHTVMDEFYCPVNTRQLALIA